LKQPDVLQLFWDLAHLDSPVLSNDDLLRFPQPLRDALRNAGLIKAAQNAMSVECNSCDLGTVGEVLRFKYADGQTRLCIMCPECGRVPVHPDRLRQWVPDYSVVGGLIATALNARGGIDEIVPGRFWKLGRAGLAGQKRPIWLVRRLDDDVRPLLPSDKRSVVFMLGIRLRTDVGIDEDRVFEVRQLVDLVDDELAFDADAVWEQLGEMVRATPPKPKPRSKDSNRAQAIKAAKHELHAHLLSMKSMNAKMATKLPRLTQRELAERIGQHPSTLSRILNEEPDELLQILWRTANNPTPEALEKYNRSHG
jgi:DNA-binding XRE family transcriptional regulator